MLGKRSTTVPLYQPQILKSTLEVNTDLHAEKLETVHQTMAEKVVLQTNKSLSKEKKILATNFASL
jgi:hypothetical protein